MNPEIEGYAYLLPSFEGGPAQVLQFIQKEERDGQFVTVRDGTTNEAVLGAVLARMRFLEAKASCIENRMVIASLETALDWLNERTKDRQERGVEGTPAA